MTALSRLTLPLTLTLTLRRSVRLRLGRVNDGRGGWRGGGRGGGGRRRRGVRPSAQEPAPDRVEPPIVDRRRRARRRTGRAAVHQRRRNRRMRHRPVHRRRRHRRRRVHRDPRGVHSVPLPLDNLADPRVRREPRVKPDEFILVPSQNLHRLRPARRELLLLLENRLHPRGLQRGHIRGYIRRANRRLSVPRRRRLVAVPLEHIREPLPLVARAGVIG